MSYIRFITLLALLTIVGCVSRFMPVVQGNVEVSGEFAILVADSTMVAARIDLWNGEPQYLTEDFSLIYVRMQNRSRESMRIYPTDFVMIDENSIQFDIVPNDIVIEIALSHPSLVPDRYYIFPDTQRENIARINTIRRNIMTRAFAFGDIHPGAIKEGILFFPKLDNKNQKFVLLYKNNEFLFKK